MSTDARILDDKRTYHEANGARLGLPPFDPEPSRLSLDKHLGRVTAAAFNSLRHDPHDPETKAAYDALKAETKAQYDHLVGRGVKFEPWTREGQPYANSADMARDARENRHLYYFPSASGFGTDDQFKDHPLMEPVPGMKGAVYNDLFRAVHAWYAHAMHGHQFGPQGELRAWHEHARMFSPLARKALTTETHGQNSWVNFGPHLRGDEGPLDKPFADQKAGILPEETHPVKLARVMQAGTGMAVRTAGSNNNDERVRIAKQVLAEAGLRARVRNVLLHDGKAARPAVAARVVHGGPQHALYAAAWLGLLTQQPAVTVFHPGEGEDSLHLLDSPHPSDHVGRYLRGAGVSRFVTEDKAGGTRAFVLNPSADMRVLARGLDASHTAIPGRADRIGAGQGAGAATGTAGLAAARAGYRTVIRDAESAAGPEAG